MTGTGFGALSVTNKRVIAEYRTLFCSYGRAKETALIVRPCGQVKNAENP
jgi:hypothetical protein